MIGYVFLTVALHYMVSAISCVSSFEDCCQLIRSSLHQTGLRDLLYVEVAFRVLSLHISTEKIPAANLKVIIDPSYSKFRAQDVTPLVHLQDDQHLAEHFLGPSYSFKHSELY